MVKQRLKTCMRKFQTNIMMGPKGTRDHRSTSSPIEDYTRSKNPWDRVTSNVVVFYSIVFL